MRILAVTLCFLLLYSTDEAAQDMQFKVCNVSLSFLGHKRFTPFAKLLDKQTEPKT